MGTRGCYGIRINQVDKLTYNQYDSYPSGLGQSLIAEFSELVEEKGYEKTLEFYKQQARNLLLVHVHDHPPTIEQKNKAYELGLVNTGVGRNTDDDWYCLLRNAQGYLLPLFQMGVLMDEGQFMTSAGCEWAYVINLDTEMFEIYNGYRREREGRYQNPRHGVSLIREIPLSALYNLDIEVLFLIPDDYKGDEYFGMY